MQRRLYDTVIMGGGVMGASIALHLARASAQRILVIERDPTYTRASSALAAGGIRQQFSIPENVQMSMYGMQFLRELQQPPGSDSERVDLQFQENGYLFLASSAGVPTLQQNHRTQHRVGATWIDLLDAGALARRFPWLDVHDVAQGSASEANEGYFDPWAFLTALRRGAQRRGVDFLQGRVSGARFSPSSTCPRIDSVEVECGTSQVSVSAGSFVNSAGAWSGQLMRTLAKSTPHDVASVPVEPRKRCIFQFESSSNPALASAPLVVLPDGVWFRPEGSSFLAGVSPPKAEDPACDDDALEVVDHHLFDSRIWPSLAKYVPAFGALRLRRAWAGFYDYNTLDQNGIIGHHPDVPNLLLCTGFSGHGLMHAPAAGRATTELLLHQRFETLDLSRFSFRRISEGSPLREQGIV
eukprot:GGOE01018437.1.p1 GENE.GGOE01018437.1~~GGOE01018437.1.p1  ORF type:complete len:412 (+),score=76.60 GGOE01018437.1:69-1304(+)